MKPVLIYSGTTEGKQLSECLSLAGIPCTVCVATEYGETVMPKQDAVTVHTGRMTAEEMQSFLNEGGFAAVVDATHPFAVEVSENIQKSLKGASLPYFRLRRDCSHETPQGRERWFSSAKECAAALKEVKGNILLTTGSKELFLYAQDDEVKKRLYVRVLPSAESIRACEEQKITGKQIIALQGPFSEELNRAIIKQYDISCIVTKESGAAGGFPEKRKAAEALGIACYIIGSPQETGLSFSEVLKELEILTQTAIPKTAGLCVTLAGIGMGAPETVTQEVKEALERADAVFGSKRALEAAKAAVPAVSAKPLDCCYRAEDILPKLEHPEVFQKWGGAVQVVVVFSGDTGFYSGCRKLRQELFDAGIQNVRILSGISCVSYLSAAAGISWEDAEIFSIHGRQEDLCIKNRLLEAVRSRGKVFVLVSGASDVQEIGKLLEENGCGNCKVILGHQLSYSEEQVREYTPLECQNCTEEGLYVCLILNFEQKERPLTHGRRDGDFLRGQVPMTKEEVRTIAISKLRLNRQGVVYDIGSGTGSVAAEIAERSSSLSVYAIEGKPEAAALIRENCRKFGLYNVTVVNQAAPEALAALPEPTHVFIGGSGGKLKEILSALCGRGAGIRVVLTAVTLETIGEVSAILKELPVSDEEIVQLQVSRSLIAGRYHRMQAENPIWVVSFTVEEE